MSIRRRRPGCPLRWPERRPRHAAKNVAKEQCLGGNRKKRRFSGAVIVLFTMTTVFRRPCTQRPPTRFGGSLRYSDGPANWRLGERVRDGFAIYEMAGSRMVGPWAVPGRVEASPFFAGMGGTGIRLPVAFMAAGFAAQNRPAAQADAATPLSPRCSEHGGLMQPASAASIGFSDAGAASLSAESSDGQPEHDKHQCRSNLTRTV